MASFPNPTIQIPFNKPFLAGNEFAYIQDAAENLGKLSGNGYYTEKCQNYFEERYGFLRCFLTTSCTDALEMAAILLDIQEGDEVIVPSFTFVSTANSFALRGAKIIFVDSQEGFPNLEVSQIESMITPKTKAIVAVHYAGVACPILELKALAEKHDLFLIEDAAQAINSFLGDKPLGSIGHLSTFSFHETKNIHCGEGGMLVVNDPRFIQRAEIIWEKGTNRSAYFRGEIDKYSWVDLGSSFLLSEINAAFLWAQLEKLEEIQNRRRQIWEDYQAWFSGDKKTPRVLPIPYLQILEEALLGLGPVIFQTHTGNYHIFYLLFENSELRQQYIQRLRRKGILAVFHYQGLHKSAFIARAQPETFQQSLPNAEKFSDCLLRLPLFYDLPKQVSSALNVKR
ncbi:dTDP-4-amino-4,6-dideoxygalactose transaminase [Algoriphagus kandeliae]|uniref:dTDP-4-amino-4,6-dideoxygalactose transaminase n=1 Tax=Algoriphagus kandeliae TaxID=2562278 RepID=A0A4Y9R1M7_9BACT|nr:dTDP-4-amino-4,6-dideoxygalactose transaminase [Algoriphagus kandeliae]TFV97246.1 dTDP-4-amino-4,6-dideoxygalactose transaminase [Algoriphagus kandeliae]